MIRVALDAMGGDHAPQVEVDGAVQALADHEPNFVVQLVGRSADIERALAAHAGVDRARLEVVEAPEVVGMHEKPLAAVRGKPRSSIAVGLELQKAGRSDAFISAGNTGAARADAHSASICAGVSRSPRLVRSSRDNRRAARARGERASTGTGHSTGHSGKASELIAAQQPSANFLPARWHGAVLNDAKISSCHVHARVIEGAYKISTRWISVSCSMDQR